MHARLLHEGILLEPAYLDRAGRASAAVTSRYIAFRLRSGDLLLGNAGLAKSILEYLVYSKADHDLSQILAAVQPRKNDSATIRRDP
jgi:hypothetical protein